MNAKWCVSTLIIILALFGLNHEQKKASNQQIVLQFTDVELASESAHEQVLLAITNKLEALGVSAIQIIEEDAKLSIQYYSDVDARKVKEFLSNDKSLTSSEGNGKELPSDFPKEKIPENYQLVVSDLQQNAETGVGLNGNFAFELKQDYKDAYYPVTPLFNQNLLSNKAIDIAIAYKINKNIVIAIDNTSHTIPLVRAGPYANRIS